MGCESSRDASAVTAGCPHEEATTAAALGRRRQRRLPDAGNPLSFSSITLGTTGAAADAVAAGGAAGVTTPALTAHRSGNGNEDANEASSPDVPYRRRQDVPQDKRDADGGGGGGDGDNAAATAPLSGDVLARHNAALLERREAELAAAVDASKASDAPVVVRLSFFTRQERAFLWLEHGVEQP